MKHSSAYPNRSSLYQEGTLTNLAATKNSYLAAVRDYDVSLAQDSSMLNEKIEEAPALVSSLSSTPPDWIGLTQESTTQVIAEVSEVENQTSEARILLAQDVQMYWSSIKQTVEGI